MHDKQTYYDTVSFERRKGMIHSYVLTKKEKICYYKTGRVVAAYLGGYIMARILYGFPLLISLAGTVGSLAFGSKKGHIICGAVMTGASILHALQHRKALAGNLKHKLDTAADYVRLPHTQPDFFMRGVQIAFYMPGRMRLYCSQLTGNEQYKEHIANYLRAFADVGRVQLNHVSGSILITYDTEKIKAYPDLARVEAYVREHAPAMDAKLK